MLQVGGLVGPAGGAVGWSGLSLVRGAGSGRRCEKTGSGSAVVLERLAGSGGVVERPALEVDVGTGVGMGKVVGAGCGK